MNLVKFLLGGASVIASGILCGSANASDTHDYASYVQFQSSSTKVDFTSCYPTNATWWSNGEEMSSDYKYYIPKEFTLSLKSKLNGGSPKWPGQELAVAGTLDLYIGIGNNLRHCLPPLALLDGSTVLFGFAYSWLDSSGDVDIRGAVTFDNTYASPENSSGRYPCVNVWVTGDSDSQLTIKRSATGVDYNDYDRRIRFTKGFSDDFLGTLIVTGSRCIIETPKIAGQSVQLLDGSKTYVTGNSTVGKLTIGENASLALTANSVLTVSKGLSVSDTASISVSAITSRSLVFDNADDTQVRPKVLVLSATADAASGIDRAALLTAIKRGGRFKGSYCALPDLLLTEEDRADGGKDFYVTHEPAVQQVSDGGYVKCPYGKTDTNSLSILSDKKALSKEKVYLTYGSNTYFSVTPYTFGGKALAVNGLLAFYSGTFTVSDLRLQSYSFIRLQAANAISQLYGTATVYKGTTIGAYGTGKLLLANTLKGSGDLCLVFDTNQAGTNKVTALVEATGDNSDFGGHFYVGSKKPPQYRYYHVQAALTNVTLRVSAGKNLGGPLSTFTYDALKIGPSCTLEVTGDATFDAANRGWCLMGNTKTNAAIKVSANKVATVKETITYGGLCEKQGEGRIVLGGAAKFYDSANDAAVDDASKVDPAKLYVKQGSLQITNKDALKGLSEVKFASGTSIVVDLAATGEVKTKGLVNPTFEKSTVPVTLVASGEFENKGETAICTVASSLKDTLKFTVSKRAFSRQMSVISTDNGDDTVTFKVHYVLGGLAVIFR